MTMSAPSQPKPAPPDFVELTNASGFAEHNGPWFEKREGALVVRGLRALPRHANGLGIVHGGLLLTFLDSTMGGAALRASGRRCVTLSLSATFNMHARIGDWIEGTAEALGEREGAMVVHGRLIVGRREILTGQGAFAMLGVAP